MANERDCLLEGLSYNLGEIIMEDLADPEVVEIMANPDGTLWIECLGEDMKFHGRLDPDKTLSVVLLMASGRNLEATMEAPIVEGKLPIDGSRFEGVLPPIVAQASFSIRKRASRVFTLTEYVEPGELLEAIREAIIKRLNINCTIHRHRFNELV